MDETEPITQSEVSQKEKHQYSIRSDQSLSLTSEDFKTFSKSLFFHIPSSPMCGFFVLINCDFKSKNKQMGPN